MKKSRFFVLLPVLASFILMLGTMILFVSCMSPFGSGGSYNYGSNGERIYFTATSSSGQSITYSGSVRMMHPITCANCHGSEGRGGRVTMMMSSFSVPDITWDKLTEAEGHNEDEHEEHPPYDEETLKSAITRGINPAGEPLDDRMPRWRMSGQDLDDLVAFIKTLD